MAKSSDKRASRKDAAKTPGKSSKQTTLRFRQSDEVGQIAAENDRFLKDAFVDAGFLETLRACDNPRSIVVGRTGAGKSAMLLELERHAEHVQRIDPLSVAIEYVQHTDIPALSTAGVNFEPFFRFLWKHVLALEILRAWHADKTDRTFGGLRLAITRRIGDKRVDEVMKHIERWCGTHWDEVQGRTKEIIQKFSHEIKGKIPFIAELSFKQESERKQGFEPRASLTPSQVSSVQRLIGELSNERVRTVFQFLETHVLTDPLKPHYIVIDHLDKAWIDSAFAYEMIEALMEAVGEFSEIPNVKVVVALREDILSALRGRERPGRNQWEKHEGLVLRIRWSKADLVSLIDRRLAIAFKGRSSGHIDLVSLLPPTEKRGRSAIDYMLERTLMRPRDLIEFINLSIRAAAAESKQVIGWWQIEAAESVYSRGRLEALENEWRALYPGIGPLFLAFNGLRGSTSIAELAADAGRINPILNHGEQLSLELPKNPKALTLRMYEMMGSSTIVEMWRQIVIVLYEIGFLGIKLPYESVSFRADAMGPQLTVDENTRLIVHPMFTRAVGVDPFGQSDDE